MTNHAHVLACLASDPDIRVRDIADTVGITERTAGQIVSQLEAAGYVTRKRVGRRNQYEIHGDLPLRHPDHKHHTVGELITFLQSGTGKDGKPGAGSS